MEAMKDPLKVIQDNREDGFTVPSSTLYPYQWNWDSGFIALGLAHSRPEMAKDELNKLFEAQWDNGMIPQIAFWNEAEGYFPGPEEWETGNEIVPTSGITQPPVLAHAARETAESLKDEEFLEHAVDKVEKYLKWWVQYRSTESGLVYVRHPWETGMDDSPAWITPMENIQPGEQEYERKDLQREDSADERPEDWDYDRYVYLVREAKSANWNEKELREKSSFLVADVLTNCIFVRACKELSKMMQMKGREREADKWLKTAQKTSETIEDELWSTELNNYVSKNLLTEKKLLENSAAGFVSFYADIPSDKRKEALLENLEENFFSKNYAVPSYVGDSYDSGRYWRGPVWINLNWLIWEGLIGAGESDYARRIEKDSKELIEKHGYREYFDPEDGTPHGSERFSWTAALYEGWLSIRSN